MAVLAVQTVIQGAAKVEVHGAASLPAAAGLSASGVLIVSGTASLPQSRASPSRTTRRPRLRPRSRPSRAHRSGRVESASLPGRGPARDVSSARRGCGEASAAARPGN